MKDDCLSYTSSRRDVSEHAFFRAPIRARFWREWADQRVSRPEGPRVWLPEREILFLEFFASFASFAVKPICGQADICRGQRRRGEDDRLLRAGVAPCRAARSAIDASHVHRPSAFTGGHA